MKYIKTYGIRGLLEWHGVIESGNIRLNVSFTNGSVTAYGVAPATFTTKNELHQHIIENSARFKRGNIILVSSHAIPGSDTPKRAANAESVVRSEEHGAGQDDLRQGCEESAESGVRSEECGERSAEVNEDGVKVVQAADKSDAIQYLKDNFGGEYTASKLRTKTAFDEACAQCGVRFVFTE